MHKNTTQYPWPGKKKRNEILKLIDTRINKSLMLFIYNFVFRCPLFALKEEDMRKDPRNVKLDQHTSKDGNSVSAKEPTS